MTHRIQIKLHLTGKASSTLGILFRHWSLVAMESREILKQYECELKRDSDDLYQYESALITCSLSHQNIQL